MSPRPWYFEAYVELHLAEEIDSEIRAGEVATNDQNKCNEEQARQQTRAGTHVTGHYFVEKITIDLGQPGEENPEPEATTLRCIVPTDVPPAVPSGCSEESLPQ